MKMKGIFNMHKLNIWRKNIFIVIIIFLFALLSGCKIKNDYVEYEDKVTLQVSDELKKYLIYPDNVPTLDFIMDNVRIAKASTSNVLYFAGNDQIALSDAFAVHLSQFPHNQILIINERNEENDNGKVLFNGQKYDLDAVDEFGNEQKYSKEYQLVAWDNFGTRYSYHFRTFVVNGIRRYAFPYSQLMTMMMQQPLMVVKEGNQNKLVLIPLPFDTKYQVNSNDKPHGLIETTEYLKESYYKFVYPTHLQNATNKKEMIQKWYEEFCDGQYLENGDIFVIKYAGAEFIVDFDILAYNNTEQREEMGFQLKYLGSIGKE